MYSGGGSCFSTTEYRGEKMLHFVYLLFILCLHACIKMQLELNEIEAALLAKGFVKEVSAKGILQVFVLQ